MMTERQSSQRRPISSFLLPNCTYAFADGELLIYASIMTEELENAFSVKNGQVIAKFTVADDNTLVFQSATVPVFADEGVRYTSTPEHIGGFSVRAAQMAGLLL